jgi:ubiquinone/menaquinone biosynthesis C-methylase UbiE
LYDKRPQPPREVLNENCENFGRISEKLNSIRKIMLEQSSLEPESSYHVTSNLNWFRYVSRVENIAKALPKEAKILEVGCGLGQVAAMLKVLRPDLKVVGSDVEYSEAWERLKSYGCDFIKSDAKNLPFGDGEFDAVVSFGVMEHVKNDDEFLGEISRVLRNCGDNFIFDLPNKYAFSEKVVGKVLSTITGKKIQHHEVRYT